MCRLSGNFACAEDRLHARTGLCPHKPAGPRRPSGPWMNRWFVIHGAGRKPLLFKEETTHFMNAIQVIFPYQRDGVWMFDDDSTGLSREPFVAGMPEIMDRVVAGVNDARNGFMLYFSEHAFPGHELQLELVAPEAGGNWYRLTGTEMKGWLCPALFRYFSTAPSMIYAKAEPRR